MNAKIMISKLTPCPKSPIAWLTVVKVLAGVASPVHGQMTGLAIAFATVLAFVWPLARVRPHMSLQQLRIRTNFSALLTLSFVAAGVPVHVPISVAYRFKGEVANLTLKGSGRRMCLQMLFQPRLIDERLLAHIALGRPFVQLMLVPLTVLPQQFNVIELFAAFSARAKTVADVWTLLPFDMLPAKVHTHFPRQIESFAA